MDLYFGAVMGLFVGYLLALLVLGLFKINFKRVSLILVCYVLVGVLLSAYSSQRHCYGEGSACVVRAGALWPFDLIWSGAKFVTMPRDVHLPSLKWD